MKVVAVLGVGPGLGLSIARRFGREGFAVALVSRTATRLAAYEESLAQAGIQSRAYVADVHDPLALEKVLTSISADLGPIDVAYFGPVEIKPGEISTAITEVEPDAVRGPFEWLVLPAVGFVNAVLPAMRARGTGTILIPGGMSGKYPMPELGKLAPASAALRMYVLTLHEALKESGVYAATLTVGGLIQRGDIHTAVREHLTQLGAELPADIDPDQIAETAWSMHVDRELAESEFSAF